MSGERLARASRLRGRLAAGVPSLAVLLAEAAGAAGCHDAGGDAPVHDDGGGPTPTAGPSVRASTARGRCFDIERFDEATGACVPSCPAGEIYVPATGPDGFVLGAGSQGDLDRPHRVVLSRPFCLDATEVTAAAYGECVQAGGCAPPRWWGEWTNYPKLPSHPVNKVGWQQAKTYCEYRGKSLPTEAQWEWAATGGDGREFPWGNEPADCERADYAPGVLPDPAPDAGCAGGGTSAVGTHPRGAKSWPAGDIHDLAGNVWEWCLDNFEPYPVEPETDPLHLHSVEAVHVIRGGGWNRSARGIAVRYRAGAVFDYQVPALGFRCARPAGRRP